MIVIAHMVVGPGEAGRYLQECLYRAARASDIVHVALDAEAGEEEVEVVSQVASQWDRLPIRWEDHEGRFRQAAWDMMVRQVQPRAGDMVLLLDADELIVSPEASHDMMRLKAGHRLPFRFYEMWSSSQYRVDGLWAPYVAEIAIPYRDGARFNDRALACGRQPTYVSDVPRFGNQVGEILHYGYARPEDRVAKYERYMRLDGGRFHNADHLKSIILPPSLKPWTKGGLLDV